MAHAQIRCHPETKSKVRPKKKYARCGQIFFILDEASELCRQNDEKVMCIQPGS